MPEETVDEVDRPDDDQDRSGRFGWSGVPFRLWIALLLAVLGAVLSVLGPMLGLVGNQPAAGYGAMPLLVVLAAVAPLLAVVFVLAGRPVLAAGVLIGFALLAPGRALTDLQFARDALLASRPELMIPTSLAPLHPAAGLWLLVAGHVLIAVAGLLVAGTAGAAPGSAYAEELDDSSGVPGARRYLIAWAFVSATVAVVGLVRPAFRSRDAFLLAREVIDGPNLIRAGGLLIIAGVVAGCFFAASSTRPSLTRGMVLGLLAAVAAVTLPGIVAGLAVDRLDPALGPYLALAAMAVLVLVVFLWPRTGRPVALPDTPAEVRLEAGRLHLVAGVLGILAALAALGGGFGRLLVVDGGLDQPASYANRQLFPAAVLVGLLAAALLVGRWSAMVRPAFTVALTSVLLVGAGALDAALTGTGISPAVHIGAGVWFTGVAMLLAVAAAACAGVAGTAERDDVDLTERGTNLTVLVPAVAAMLLAVGAFGLPALKAPDFVAPGIWSQFRLTSWGLLLGLLVVIAVGALAPVSRPARGAALLLGAAGVVVVRLLEFPLTSARAAEASPGPGTWLSLACAVVLVIAAVVALVTRPSQR